MATAEQIAQFNQMAASGDYSGAGQLASSAGYSAADVASYLNAPVEAVSQYMPAASAQQPTGSATAPFDHAAYIQQQAAQATSADVGPAQQPYNLLADANQAYWGGPQGVNWATQNLTAPDAAWRQGGTADGFGTDYWSNPASAAWLDEGIGALERAGFSNDETSRIAQYYGVTPEALAAMSGSEFNKDRDDAGRTADQWIQALQPTDYFNDQNSIYNWSRPYLSSPYEALAGQGDLYAGLAGRGYEGPFIRQVMQGAPGSLTSADLRGLTSPFFNAENPFGVTAVNQDFDKIRQSLSQALGTTDHATIAEAAKYLYGVDIPAPAIEPPERPSSGGGNGGGSSWTGGSGHPIDTNAGDTSGPFSGQNWRGTLLSQMGMSEADLYNHFMSVSSGSGIGDWNLARIQQEFGLNPGEAQALYEAAINYARANGLPLPRLSATTTSNAPFVNYGFGPQQQLHEWQVGGQSAGRNPLRAIMANITAAREAAVEQQAPVKKARGGYMKGGLTGVASDPVVKRYMKGGGGGQQDDIPAMLSSGEYVMDADVVSALGDGNPEAGATKLDQMRVKIRQHKRAAPTNKIPPKAKNPEQYLKGK